VTSVEFGSFQGKRSLGRFGQEKFRQIVMPVDTSKPNVQTSGEVIRQLKQARKEANTKQYVTTSTTDALRKSFFRVRNKVYSNDIRSEAEPDEDFLLDLGRPSRTITASHVPPFYDGPVLRNCTCLELKMLMGFPMDYVICGPPTRMLRQIGNAVPVNMAKHIAAIFLL
jgi:site-specific DNA-cytosine methylase